MNFILEPDKKSAFAGNIDVDTIILNLSALIPGSRFVDGKTCIILDEIQECREAKTIFSYTCFTSSYLHPTKPAVTIARLQDLGV